MVDGAAQVIAAVCTLDYTKPGKPDIDWDDPQAKQNLVSDLVNDALRLLDALAGPGAPERDAAAADALGLLALVAGQDVEPAEDSDGTDGRWRIARKVAPDRVISTVDREARHTRKSKSKRRDGFRGHVAAEPDTGLITDCEMTMAAGDGSSDADNGVKMAARDRFHGAGEDEAAGDDAASARDDAEAGPAGASPAAAGEAPAGLQPEPGTDVPADEVDQARDDDLGREDGLEVYGDSAYGSGEARAAYRDAGHDTVIKPKPLQPAVPGGFTLDDFTIDEDRGTVTCPAGQVRQMSASRTVSFGAACAACPLRERCTTAKGGRSMTIHPHEGLLRAARAQARTEQFKRAYPTRSAIERIIAWTATQKRPPGQAPLHRDHQERRLAAHPVRCDQPAHPAAARPGALRWRLGPGLNGQEPAHPVLPAAPAGSRRPPRARPSLLKTGGPGKHERVPGALPDQAAGRPSANPGSGGS